jgi:hypothetical protein
MIRQSLVRRLVSQRSVSLKQQYRFYSSRDWKQIIQSQNSSDITNAIQQESHESIVQYREPQTNRTLLHLVAQEHDKLSNDVFQCIHNQLNADGEQEDLVLTEWAQEKDQHGDTSLHIAISKQLQKGQQIEFEPLITRIINFMKELDKKKIKYKSFSGEESLNLLLSEFENIDPKFKQFVFTQRAILKTLESKNTNGKTPVELLVNEHKLDEVIWLLLNRELFIERDYSPYNEMESKELLKNVFGEEIKGKSLIFEYLPDRQIIHKALVKGSTVDLWYAAAVAGLLAASDPSKSNEYLLALNNNNESPLLIAAKNQPQFSWRDINMLPNIISIFINRFRNVHEKLAVNMQKISNAVNPILAVWMASFSKQLQDAENDVQAIQDYNLIRARLIQPDSKGNTIMHYAVENRSTVGVISSAVMIVAPFLNNDADFAEQLLYAQNSKGQPVLSRCGFLSRWILKTILRAAKGDKGAFFTIFFTIFAVCITPWFLMFVLVVVVCWKLLKWLYRSLFQKPFEPVN